MEFEFNFPSPKEELEEEESRKDHLKRLFCSYAHLDPNIKITKDDINFYKFEAFERVRLKDGCTEEELLEALLG